MNLMSHVTLSLRYSGASPPLRPGVVYVCEQQQLGYASANELSFFTKYCFSYVVHGLQGRMQDSGLGGGTMASAEREPITGVFVGVRGRSPPEAASFLALVCLAHAAECSLFSEFCSIR